MLGDDKRVESPCKDCIIRDVGCHTVCMMYANYREKLNAIRAVQIEAKKKAGSTMCSGIKRTLNRKARERIGRRAGGRK